MFKSFIGKFILFFWLFFFVVTLPIYFFSNFQFKEIIKASEKEKVEVTLKALKPIISIHMFLDQEKQLNELLDNMFEYDYIKSIMLVSKDQNILYKRIIKTHHQDQLMLYKSDIPDMLSSEKAAEIRIQYSNKHMEHFNEKISIILISTFLFSLLIFSVMYYYIRFDLVALKKISHALKEYSKTKGTKKITHQSISSEIKTIADVANEMFVNIAQYVKKLKSFNHELESKVQEEIKKQQTQERMMVHQSRQAAMGEMLESIAHQWRQPLNIIGLATANLETEYELGIIDKEKFHEKMELISKNINYMSDTIDDFRDFLNPKKTSKSFEAKKSIESVLGILDAQLKNYNINYQFSGDLNPIFKGIENEFKQVIIIILNNSKDAIKLIQQSNPKLKGNISINISRQNGYGVIKICDNGGGIDESIIDSVFNPYFTTKENANGTGIGLYIAKNIIESRMKGDISVKNTNEGCCFSISLPLSNES
jgi:signal transduction histidine kinase